MSCRGWGWAKCWRSCLRRRDQPSGLDLKQKGWGPIYQVTIDPWFPIYRELKDGIFPFPLCFKGGGYATVPTCGKLRSGKKVDQGKICFSFFCWEMDVDPLAFLAWKIRGAATWDQFREIHQTYPQNCIKFEDVVLNKILQSFGTPEILPSFFLWIT